MCTMAIPHNTAHIPDPEELFSPKASKYRRFAKSTRPIGTIINAALCRPYFLIRVF